MARTRKVNRSNPAGTSLPHCSSSEPYPPVNSIVLQPSTLQYSATSDSTSGPQSPVARFFDRRLEPSLAFLDYNQGRSFMDLPSIDFTHSTKPPWFSEETRYAMGNGEAWVDMLSSGSLEDLNGYRKPKEGKAPSTSNAKMRELHNLKQHPRAKRSKIKETETGAGLKQSIPKIPDTAQRRREPRVKWIDPRDLVKCKSFGQEPSPVFQRPQVLDKSLEQRENRQPIEPLITIPGRNLKSLEHHQDPFYLIHRQKNMKQHAKVSNEKTKHIADTYMWSGPIEGNGTQTRKKFGMCGLNWMDILNFLKAPTVGGKPAIAVTRITPGGSTSKVIIDDLMLQLSVPEADFLGNYKGGTIGVLGELGIQPVTYNTDYGNHLGRLLVDRTCLNGIFLFDYRGEDMKDENKASYESATRDMYLDSSSKWKWFLETFFTSDTQPGRKEPQTIGGRKNNTSPHVQISHSVYFHEPSIPAVVVDKREQEHMLKFSDSQYSDLLKPVLPRYIPRPGLPPSIGSLLIVVPLNGGRIMCEMNRLNEIHEQETINSLNTPPKDQWRGMWLLLDAPITNMKWIQSAARNIYKLRSPTQQSFEDERLTQSVAVDFSRKLWLDICEGMQLGWGKFPETEEVRTARIMKNRQGGQSRKEKQELSETEKALNNQHHKYSITESTIENELKEHGYRRCSEWDKLATGWMTEKFLDEPTVAKLVEAKRKRMAMENEWEKEEVKNDNVQARIDNKDEEETYLVISGCTLAKEFFYNKFASILASEQHIGLSSSNLHDSSYPGGQQRANGAVVNISCEEPIPAEVIHGKHWMSMQRNNWLPTSWQDHGGVRDLLGNGHNLDTKTVSQTYVVVLALITNSEGKHPSEEKLQAQPDSQTPSYKRQPENQRPVDRRPDIVSQGIPEKNGGPRQYELGLTTQHFELGSTLPTTSSFQLEQHIHPTSPLEPKSKLTDVPHTLASLLGSNEYKVVAVYPQKKCCAYCSCVINTKENYDVVRCGKSDRSLPTSGKGIDFVHHTDEQALREGCSCNEAKGFHKANGCLSHCQYCNERCKDKQCEEEMEMELVWSRMVDHFRLMDGLDICGRPEDSSMVVGNIQHELQYHH